MKVLGIITSPTEASARARIIQYKSPLSSYNIHLTPRYFKPLRYDPPSKWSIKAEKITGISQWRFYQLHRSLSRLPLFFQQYNYNLLWLNRLIIHHHSFYERKLSKPIVFDFDDAIWLNDNPLSVRKALAKATLVFAGNDYLAQYAVQYNRNTIVIPTVINPENFYPVERNETKFTIGWSGTVSNFRYLDIIKPAIDEFLTKNNDTRFMVVSSEKPGNFSFDDEKMIFRKWSAETENELINEFDIGVMPLDENDFTKGKCSYKMLQYLACGKPAVVSPVGTNTKILSESEVGLAATTKCEWIDAFNNLKQDKSFYKRCALNGRKIIEDRYSVHKTAPVIAEYFKKLV
jgi:glycosyltransferase involved in cell wall biosynthesis